MESQASSAHADIVQVMQGNSGSAGGRRIRGRGAAVLAAATLFLASCAVAEPAPSTTTIATPATTRVPAPPTPTTTLPPITTTVPDDASLVPDVPPHHTLVGLAIGETEVFQAPGATESTLTLPAQTILGTTTVLGVVDVTEEGWAQVRLPVRPNGSTGWVKVEALEFYLVSGRIVVDLGSKRLSYFDAGEEVLSSDIAIGTSRNPTPIGEFFVTDSVELGDPNSPWGPHALGISAYSETITEYNGGPGIIGIHGTNKPSSIGTAASLGCVRMPNDLITALYALVTLGTPVEIKA